MPVYLFTYHAYRSWMPGHQCGYTRRGEGYLPSDEEVARQYEERSKNEPTLFNSHIQREMIEELMHSCACIEGHLHGASTEPSHIHGLVSWRHERAWLSVRSSLKSSLTKRLKQIAPGLALSRGASRKHVIERSHFDYLMQTYLPQHGGVSWFEHKGWLHLR